MLCLRLADSIQTKAEQREAICSLIFQYDPGLFAGSSYGMGREGRRRRMGEMEVEGTSGEWKEHKGSWYSRVQWMGK